MRRTQCLTDSTRPAARRQRPCGTGEGRLITNPGRYEEAVHQFFFYSILTNGSTVLACLPMLWLMALFFKASCDTDWRAFKATAWLQLGFALTVPYLLFAEVPLGQAIGAASVAASRPTRKIAR